MGKYATDQPNAAALTGDELLQLVQSSADVKANVRTLRAAKVVIYTESRTALLSDQVMVMNSGSDLTVTIPPNADVALPVGSFIEVWGAGAGTVTIVPGTGVTILKKASKTMVLDGLDAGVSLRKTGTNTWRMIGELGEA